MKKGQNPLTPSPSTAGPLCPSCPTGPIEMPALKETVLSTPATLNRAFSGLTFLDLPEPPGFQILSSLTLYWFPSYPLG